MVVQANGNRILDGLGVYKKFAEVCGAEPLPSSIRRYADGTPIIYREPDEFTNQWGFPYVKLLPKTTF
jgi:salicylate hydroxylase